MNPCSVCEFESKSRRFPIRIFRTFHAIATELPCLGGGNRIFAKEGGGTFRKVGPDGIAGGGIPVCTKGGLV